MSRNTNPRDPGRAHQQSGAGKARKALLDAEKRWLSGKMQDAGYRQAWERHTAILRRRGQPLPEGIMPPPPPGPEEWRPGVESVAAPAKPRKPGSGGKREGSGRPPSGAAKAITGSLRLTAEEWARWDAECARLGVSRGQWILGRLGETVHSPAASALVDLYGAEAARIMGQNS